MIGVLLVFIVLSINRQENTAATVFVESRKAQKRGWIRQKWITATWPWGLDSAIITIGEAAVELYCAAL